MNTKMIHAIAVSAMACVMTPAALAGSPEPLEWMAGKDGCHVLLTEKECAAHRATLTALTSIAQRYAYLEAHGIVLRDREVMCSCKRNTPETVYYPHRQLRLAHR